RDLLNLTPIENTLLKTQRPQKSKKKLSLLSRALRSVRHRNEREKTNMRTNNFTMDTLPEWFGNQPAAPIANRFTSMPIPTNSSDTRAYFQRLRSAEMAEWERTGGDYLLSRRARDE